MLLPNETDYSRSTLRELTEYFRISEAEARSLCETGLADAKREWGSAARHTTDEVLSFYRTTRSYIFEHIWWHVTDTENNAGNIAILDFTLDRGLQEYLDFGSGVGANAILFARYGLGVTLADVSRSMLDFARWRLERRGLKATYIDLCEAELPSGRFDLVTAVDVFEHLVDPGVEIARIGAALRTGGVLIFNDQTGPDPERPMHIVLTRYPIFRALRRNGFRRTNADELYRLGYHVQVRGGRGRLADLAWGLYDFVRYGPLGLAARAAFLACRGRWMRAR